MESEYIQMIKYEQGFNGAKITCCLWVFVYLPFAKCSWNNTWGNNFSVAIYDRLEILSLPKSTLTCMVSMRRFIVSNNIITVGYSNIWSIRKISLLSIAKMSSLLVVSYIFFSSNLIWLIISSLDKTITQTCVKSTVKAHSVIFDTNISYLYCLSWPFFYITWFSYVIFLLFMYALYIFMFVNRSRMVCGWSTAFLDCLHLHHTKSSSPLFAKGNSTYLILSSIIIYQVLFLSFIFHSSWKTFLSI